ncbi:RHS repeat-associated core domain-containing protein [Longimicrobium sp.]|uniref:RHS repeat-associated core domain-containing protein n=1 Tax=Longimicrobium sp. TaxID=2029185 RepID=UPI002E374141|nr:RHS repeat-associated core domain-containing protein [Longimicrobium sp.]HEX6042345.1 RHS repeat-associated core domain-containing protein [Longimicrobium sp.]
MLLHAAGLLLALVLSAGTAAAQPSCTEDPCGGTGDEFPPNVSVSPASGTYSQPSIPVLISMGDGYSLRPDSLRVTLNDTVVTSAFQYTPTPGSSTPKATARGTIQLKPGTNTLRVQMCDLGPLCRTVETTYAYGVPGVSVSPDGGVSYVARGNPASQTFTIQNTGPASATFTLQAVCREVYSGAAVSSCTLSSPSVTLNPGASTTVTVGHGYNAAGSSVSVELRARHATVPSVADMGWVELDVRNWGGVPSTMTVALVDLNSTGTISRDECVTVSAGAGAAYECGDLRLAHGVPGMATLGRGRAPVLLYNSQHAQPYPTVYADVTLPEGVSPPQQVVATVTTASGVVYTRTFTGSDWWPGMTRRIGVQWDGRSDGWWLKGYTLQVTAVYGGGVQHSTQVQGEIALVNRIGSAFGAGWWLAGLEQLSCVGCPNGNNRSMLRTGDGSTRVLEEVVSGYMWVAQNPGGRPDTLILEWLPTGAQYKRKLQGGGEIHYDGEGRHVRTVSRLNDTTHFSYDGSSTRLLYVSVPRRDGVARGFSFSYTGGYLTGVQLQINGVPQPGITLTNSGGRVTAITDPDGLKTQFGYGDPNNPNRITSRTSRDTTAVTFGYDAAGRMNGVALALNGTQSITTLFTAAEGRGVNPGSTTLSSVLVSEGYTLINGPRADVADETRIWVTSRGAPRRIRDALGGETVLVRGNATYPSLVTEVRGPNARGDSLVVKSTAGYDFRGRVDSTTVVNPLGDGQNLTTRYTYDNLWDSPATVTAPGVGQTSMAYDPQTGNLLWQQQGSSTRRVYYDYHTTGVDRGLLARVRYPHPVTGAAGGGGADSLGYDASSNLRFTRTPLGFLTHHYRDQYGRDTLVITPVRADSADTELELQGNGTRARTGYDLMGRVAWTEAVGRPVALPASADGRVPARTSPTETLRVETQFDAMGRARIVNRWSTPDVATAGVLRDSMTYDRAGRMLTRKKSGVGAESFVYDPAGNVTSTTTPRGHTISMEYDVLGRLVRRGVPAATDAAGCPPLWSSCPRFPYYSTGTGGGFAAPAENYYYRYDGLGNQVYAENLDAKVVRSYYPGGALRTDSTYMRAYAGMDYATHAFGLEYRYDAVGRLRALQHPTNLTGTAQADSFAYDATTGAMVYARSRQGHAYSFAYDLLGRPVRLGYPGGGAERTTYDADGRRFARLDSLSTAASYAVLSADTFAYDARGKVTYINGKAGSQATHFRNWYSGLGNLLGTDWGNVTNFAGVTETFVVDAMGNQAQSSRWVDGAYDPIVYSNAYQPGRGRIGNISKVAPTNPPSASFRPDSTLRYYDNAGNVTWGIQHQYGNVGSGGGMGGNITPNGIGIAHQTITRNFYGADNTVRVVQVHDQTYPYTYNGSYAEYRYDPLGRRIMERTRRDTVCSTSSYGCESTLTRFVWAGDQLLWELRVPGGNDVQVGPSGLDATSASGAMYGRVSYFHAGGIDKPLLITKEGAESVVPRDTWRGQFHAGTSPTTGLVRDCQQGGQTGCLLIAWPGWRTTATHAWGGEEAPDIDVWYGGLVDGMRDASGQMYMRNRYYDPATGQFTQTDPIGLAGGLNAYGFAAGDPVSYSDPYGLCPIEKDGIPCRAEYAAGVTVSSPKLRRFLDDFAAEQNRTVMVYSGDRDAARNAQAGGARSSFHTRGQAADLIFKDGTKKETVRALYTSSVRQEAGVRLLYHGPGAKLPEHSHVDLGDGPDLFEQPREESTRYVPLQPAHVFGPGRDRRGEPVRTSGGAYPIP